MEPAVVPLSLEPPQPVRLSAAAPTAPNRAILGSNTELSGDFRYPGWGGSSAGASDQDIQKLTIGYGTMETNQGGAYVWNETAVKDHTETDNDDGTATYTVTINEGLTFSDGTPITAVNYLAQVMAFSTPVAVAAGMPGTMGQSFVGYKEFNATPAKRLRALPRSSPASVCWMSTPSP